MMKRRQKTMPNNVIAEGKTTNEAIENGLKKLGVSKNQVEIKILQNDDKRSFFSILAPRIVKVELILKDENTNNTRIEEKQVMNTIGSKDSDDGRDITETPSDVRKLMKQAKKTVKKSTK